MFAGDPEVFYRNIGKTVTCLLDDIGVAAVGDGRVGRALARQRNETKHFQRNIVRICASLEDDTAASSSIDLIYGGLDAAANRNGNI